MTNSEVTKLKGKLGRFGVLLFPVAFVLLLLLIQNGQTAQDARQTPCSDCHVCSSPTAKDPCLKICLRPGKAEKAHSPAEGPSTAILGQLQDIYKPVKFNHKLHADMVGMGQGCVTCHHYSPPGKFPPCRECHGDKSSNPQNLKQPGLKGAYHRQCMGCHREWSHETKCVVCHLPEPGKILAAGIDSTDILGIAHPKIIEPETKVYQTPYKNGPVVTFHHREHLELFGLSCANCHRQENCSYCHDLQKPVKAKKTMEEVHAICNDCHAKDSCSKCHDTGQKPVFSHASTAWPLNEFHAKLDCRACHPTGKKIARLDNACNSCHAGWNQSNFNHARVGLRLDEVHLQADCSDCHPERKFDQTPVCTNCHEDGRTYLTAPPGELIK
jgi:hypothetical protein